MIFIGLLAILGIVFAAVVIHNIRDPWGVPLFAGIGTLFLGGIAFGILFTISVGIAASISPVNTYKTHDLKALANSTQASGSFFLGIGSIDGEDKVGWVEKWNDDSVHIKSKDVDDVTIYERGGEDARVVYTSSKFNYWWLSPFDFSFKNETNLYVPEGTVKQNYVITAPGDDN